MIKCPYCRKDFNDVKNSRSTFNSSQIWRRRLCRKCGKTFTTYEKVRPDFLFIIKSSGKRERYRRANVYTGIYKAGLSSPNQEEIVNKIVDIVESKILDTGKKEIHTHDLSDIVLSVLKRKNIKTFVRFLVYNKHPKGEEEFIKLFRKY